MNLKTARKFTCRFYAYVKRVLDLERQMRMITTLNQPTIITLFFRR